MSTLKTNTLSNVAGTQSTAIENAINGSAKAWVNFNGTGTVAIRASYNVSSITDNGTGDYTINLTNAMPDTNYSTVIGGQAIIATNFGVCTSIAYNTTPTTSSINVTTHADNGTKYDLPIVNVSIFR
jgi:hypothetical protein